VKILEAITDETLATLDLTQPVVTQNSFPTLIASGDHAFPPMFILHGEMDELLPFRQSVRLCNAISGSQNANQGPAPLSPNLDTYVRRIQCNKNGSQLHLIAEGSHALDLCISEQLCLSGVSGVWLLLLVWLRRLRMIELKMTLMRNLIRCKTNLYPATGLRNKGNYH